MRSTDPDSVIPMPPYRFDPVTGAGPAVVHPDRCPAGHRYHYSRARGGSWHHTPPRPGNRRDYWTCYDCAPPDHPLRGVDFLAAPELYDVDPATWYWDPFQVRRRAEVAETLRRMAEDRHERLIGPGW